MSGEFFNSKAPMVTATDSASERIRVLEESVQMLAKSFDDLYRYTSEIDKHRDRQMSNLTKLFIAFLFVDMIIAAARLYFH